MHHSQDVTYRTGDLGRYRPDDDLEMLGRKDDQLKVHGARVEPAEVSAVLLEHQEVQSCAVLGVMDDDNQRILVAYVVRTKNAHLDQAELRSFLSERVIAYMVPSRCVFLTQMPLTPNGKVDRQVLADISTQTQRINGSDRGPRTKEESTLLDIWRDVLNQRSISINDDFFDLGGHSMFAMRVFGQIKERFGIDCLWQSLFRHPPLRIWHNNLSALTNLKATGHY